MKPAINIVYETRKSFQDAYGGKIENKAENYETFN